VSAATKLQQIGSSSRHAKTRRIVEVFIKAKIAMKVQVFVLLRRDRRSNGYIARGVLSKAVEV
jgi:hypothetical protein